MQIRPVIGIATETLEPMPTQILPAWLIEQRYVNALAALGAVPWLIPLLKGEEETLQSIYDHLDGIFLTGGVDVGPDCYREERRPTCGRIDPPRDWIETRLIRWAIRDRKPILGVCRGMQLINAATGGTLYQDVPTEIPGAVRHDGVPAGGCAAGEPLMHPIHVEPGSQLEALLGAVDIEVNSSHHQAVKKLAPGLVATAWGPDGVIEGIEAARIDGQYLVGVQWHPEDLAQTVPAMRLLLESFLEAAIQYRSTRAADLAPCGR
jgi:putative glutamine amidotransferase